jgi:hypothetical protein
MAILKDRTAINILKRARSSDLEYNIQTFPEEERDGKTDLEILRDEMDYLISMYEEEGTIYSNDLEEAREILRETRYGKANIITSDFRLKYSDWDIQRSRATVNEYNRLKLLMREV